MLALKSKFLHVLSTMLQKKQSEKSDNSAEEMKQNNSTDSEGVSLKESVHTSQAADLQPTMMECNDEENPSTMSVMAVMKMFQQMNQDRQKDKEELHSFLKEMKKSCKQKAVEAAETAVKAEVRKIKTIEHEVAYWRLKSDTLTDVCNRMAVEMADMLTRIENLELNNSKSMLLLSGLLIEGEGKKQGIEFLNDFLQYHLGSPVNIDDFFNIGDAQLRQTVLIFQSIEEKRQVLRNKKKLKNFRNDREQSVYINEYLPPAALEKKRKESDIVSTYEQLGEQDSVSYNRGSLHVGNKPYRKLIVPPTPKELIQIDPERLENILCTKTQKGENITQDRSTFTAYAADVDNHQQIHDLYIRTKLVQPEARHIVCAYNLDDDQFEDCYKQDYHDDGEPGAGRILLNILKHYDIKNKVVLVARKYGGIRMGTERFDCYAKAACGTLGVNIPPKPARAQSRPRYNAQQEVQNSESADPTSRQTKYKDKQSTRGHSMHKRRGAYPPGVHRSPLPPI